jgi:signal transduction histidine kinase
LRLQVAWGEAAKDQRAEEFSARESERNEPEGALHQCLARVLDTLAVVVGENRLCVPLLAQGRLHGVLDLLHPNDSNNPPMDLSFYEALGRELGAAIQNAILFEEVAASRERLQNLSRRLVEIQEAERRHIARELHDEAGQVLMGLKLGLRELERNADNPRRVISQVTELRQMANGVLESLHQLAMDLRPASLEHLGLIEALQQYAETVADRHGIVIDFEAVGLSERLPANIENALYRIVQEALANVIHHAQARRVDILLEQRHEKIILMIEDDGVGIGRPEALTGKDGRLGLVGIRERAEMLGGSLVIETGPGQGTTLLVEAPYGVTHSHRG